MPAEKSALLNKINRVTAESTVGGLRQLEDDDWKEMDVPLLCRVYLQHLLRQSVSLTNQQLLECDFNSGLPFDWEGVADKVAAILALGFRRDEALEAILVTGNKTVEHVLF